MSKCPFSTHKDPINSNWILSPQLKPLNSQINPFWHLQPYVSLPKTEKIWLRSWLTLVSMSRGSKQEKKLCRSGVKYVGNTWGTQFRMYCSGVKRVSGSNWIMWRIISRIPASCTYFTQEEKNLEYVDWWRNNSSILFTFSSDKHGSYWPLR